MLDLKRPCKGIISSRFGFRWKPKKGWHSGLDIANLEGTPIYPAYKGKIVFAGKRGNYGKCVIVEHKTLGKVWTLYAHLSRDTCCVGQSVSTDSIIGLMGSTGYSTGSHLHFEVRYPINGIAFAHNPERFLQRG